MRIRTATRRAVAALAGVLAITLAASACSGAGRVAVDVPAQVEGELSEDTAAQLQSAITFAMAASGSPGAVVGVWAPWSGSWVAGVGTQSPSDPDPVSADMAFRVGDLTRPMICDVLFETAAAGTVGLDDSVTDYVSGMPQLAGVTLRQLCDGTSGVTSYTQELIGLWLSNPDRVWNPRELAAYGLGNTPEPVSPGTTFVDSDAGYVLLGLALERATSRSARSLMDELVFERLGMQASALPAPAAADPEGPDGALTGNHTLPGADGAMNCAEPVDITELSSSVGYTNAGVTSDVADMRAYVQALASGALVEKDQKRFAAPKPAYDGAPSWYTTAGGAIQAGSLTGQVGWVPGYASAAFADATTGLTVVVALNNSGGGDGIVGALALQLAAIASKAPAAGGQTAPDAGLPWTAQQYADSIAAAAFCPLPAA